ncbi:hypothetical protein [uncultured Aquimarina sp.]|uniref:hypothetical protein n=1 Tax=uncultured Aquimarina sp. TaxID=575652 RepID=UPI0026116894|nr:hypothetical protein [uncultured Aquimarina sp.]
MKPAHIKSQRQKEIRRIQKRQRNIWEEQRNLGYIKLEKPIRHGWFKESVITKNVEKYKNQEYIEELHKKLEKSFWGRTKQEAEKNWLHETSKYLINKELPTISPRSFNKLSDGAQRMCVPFRYYTKEKKLKLRFYVNLPKGTYKIKFTKAYVTHSKRIDPKLESEDALIEQQLLKNGYFEEVQKQYNWRDYWQISKAKKEKLKINSKLRDLKKYKIPEILKEEISWERN